MRLDATLRIRCEGRSMRFASPDILTRYAERVRRQAEPVWTGRVGGRINKPIMLRPPCRVWQRATSCLPPCFIPTDLAGESTSSSTRCDREDPARQAARDSASEVPSRSVPAELVTTGRAQGRWSVSHSGHPIADARKRSGMRSPRRCCAKYRRTSKPTTATAAVLIRKSWRAPGVNVNVANTA